jgi:hypothetical protein
MSSSSSGSVVGRGRPRNPDPEKDHFFVAIARRWIEAADRSTFASATDLFFALTRCRSLG